MKGYKYKQTKIKGRSGTFKLWIADSYAKKVKGLSNIRSLGKNEGMIFVYEDEDFRTFTMKNTYIPLEIYFCDKDFNVLEVVRGKPRNRSPIKSKVKAKYVIEILGK